MKLILFNHPKKTIVNLLFILGILATFISLVACIVIILWNIYPDSVKQWDKVSLDFYNEKIESLYDKTQNKKVEQHYKDYLKLYDELEDISILNRFYSYRKQSAQFLIQYYLTKNNINPAMDIASKWEKQYPFDFDGKFAYIHVLSAIDKNKALKYFKKLYHSHKDIVDLKNKYIEFLIDEKQYNTALSIDYKIVSDTNDIPNKYMVPFQVYYNDNKESFSGEQSIKYHRAEMSLNDEVITYHIQFSKKIDKLKGLRFDVDQLRPGLKISSLSAFVSGKNFKEPLIISNTNQLIMIGNNEYVVDGEDPHFNFVLSDKLKHYSGQLEAGFSIKIDTSNPNIKKIIHDPGWKIFVTGEHEFNKKQSSHFTLKKQSNYYVYQGQMAYKNINKIKLELPSLVALKIKNLKLIINNDLSIDFNNMSSSNGISVEPDYFEIKAKDPFIIFDLKETIDIDNYKVAIVFYGDDSE